MCPNKIRFDLCLLTLLLIFSACSPEPEQTTISEIIVNNGTMAGRQPIDPIVERMEITLLETSPNGLIPEHPPLFLSGGDRIFVGDVVNGKLTIFDARDGRFIKQLSASGEGPGEFSFFSALTFNPFAEELDLYAGFEGKDLIFDKDGNFLREEKLDLMYDSKKYLSKEVVVFSSHSANPAVPGAEKPHKILWRDKTKNEWKFFLPFEEEPSEVGYFSTSGKFYAFENELLWFEQFNPQIKTISSKGLEDRYAIRFTTNPMPVDFLKENKKYTYIHELIDAKKFPFLNGFFFENQNLIVFPYHYDKMNRLFVYDKKQNKPWFDLGLIELARENLTLPMPIAADAEGLLFLYPSAKIKKLVRDNPIMKRLPPAILAANKKLREGDNPVLIKVVMR